MEGILKCGEENKDVSGITIQRDIGFDIGKPALGSGGKPAVRQGETSHSPGGGAGRPDGTQVTRGGDAFIAEETTRTPGEVDVNYPGGDKLNRDATPINVNNLGGASVIPAGPATTLADGSMPEEDQKQFNTMFYEGLNAALLRNVPQACLLDLQARAESDEVSKAKTAEILLHILYNPMGNKKFISGSADQREELSALINDLVALHGPSSEK